VHGSGLRAGYRPQHTLPAAFSAPYARAGSCYHGHRTEGVRGGRFRRQRGPQVQHVSDGSREFMDTGPGASASSDASRSAVGSAAGAAAGGEQQQRRSRRWSPRRSASSTSPPVGRFVFAIQASSAESEHVLSAAGRLITALRSRFRSLGGGADDDDVQRGAGADLEAALREHVRDVAAATPERKSAAAARSLPRRSRRLAAPALRPLRRRLLTTTTTTTTTTRLTATMALAAAGISPWLRW
jgi:hypothetical protein